MLKSCSVGVLIYMYMYVYPHAHTTLTPSQPSHTTQVESPPLPPINPTLSEELIATFDDTYTQMASLYQGKCVDPRLAHVVTYAIHSGATKELLRSLVLEMIIQQVSADPPRANLRILAQKEFLALFSKRNMQGDIDVSSWLILSCSFTSGWGGGVHCGCVVLW